MSKRYIFLMICILSCSMSKNENFPCRIPIYYLSCSDSPLVKVNIEGSDYNLKIDLGTNSNFTLKSRVLDHIRDKKWEGKSRHTDIRNNQYESNKYKISPIKLGHLKIEDAIVSEEHEFFIAVGSKPFGSSKSDIDKQLELIDGRIGCSVFNSCSCFFDFKHSLFCVSPGFDEIKKSINWSEGIEANFDYDKELICVEFLTEQGTKRFVLDTGASRSLVNRSSFIHANQKKLKIQKLELGSKNLGPWHFYCLDASEKLGADGILGMDFFKRFAVYIDFPNRKLFLLK